MKQITVIGSLNYDLVTYTDIVPEGGETVQANAFENHLGGKGLNESIAVARLSKDTEVRMIGNVGNDSFGKELKQALIDAKVDTSYINTIAGISSGVAVILVEKSGENRILITAGANGELKPSVEDYETYFKQDAGFVLLQNEYPHTIESINWLKSNRPSINISYNPSPFKPEYIKSEVLSKIDLLIVNETEALDVAGSLLSAEEADKFKTRTDESEMNGFKELSEKLVKLINQDNVNLVIITMGSKGCLYSSKSTGTAFQASEKVKNVVDTTGAGDTFFGGVVSQLSNGSTIPEAVKFATKASSLVIQKKGAVESIPFAEDVEKL